MKRLLYPSCGVDDALHFLDLFASEIDEFIFADLNFRLRDVWRFKHYIEKTWGKSVLTVLGNFRGIPVRLYDPELKRYYRKVAPAYAIFEFETGGKFRRVILRKGFGQFALLELSRKSLDIFVHRGDSLGEGGSGVFYLGNLRLRYDPISNLFDKLVERLKDRALIISDGSNTTFRDFREFYLKIEDLSRKEVESLLPFEIKIKNIKLRAERVIDRRYNHTIIWRVYKQR